MASPKQLTANRANAKKSTGPRTPKGKAASRFNALKFGITAQSLLLPNESVDDFEALAVEYDARFRPQSPEQRFLVKSLVTADWFTDRLNRAEPDVWTHDFATTVSIGGHADGDGVVLSQHPSFQHYSRLRRCHSTLHRSYIATMKELRAEGVKPADPIPEPASAPQPELASFCTSPVPLPQGPHMMQLVPRQDVGDRAHADLLPVCDSAPLPRLRVQPFEKVEAAPPHRPILLDQPAPVARVE